MGGNGKAWGEGALYRSKTKTSMTSGSKELKMGPDGGDGSSRVERALKMSGRGIISGGPQNSGETSGT